MVKKAVKSAKKSGEKDIEDIDIEDLEAEEDAEQAEAARQTGVPHEEQVRAPDADKSEEQDAGEPVPPAGSHKITIEGEGTVPIIADGAMSRLPRGEKIEVTDAQLEAIKKADLKFKGK